jgi:CubicO group peptidase (beta-lactamase class C family)
VTTPVAAPATSPTPIALAADTPQSTPEGATFTAPAKWSVVSSGARVLLTGPEPDLRIVVGDSPHGLPPDEAVAAAWSAMRPDFRRTLHLAQTRPARHGWDEHRTYDYETSPDEKIVVFAHAFRHGDSWAVLTVEGGQASFEKRLSQVILVGDSLRPRGYTMESFAGKTPHALDKGRVQQIVDSIEKARARAGVPGIAMALVQDGKVVYEGGLGVRDLRKPDKVDPRTLFLIASNTKALTTLLLAKLVDEGKLGWDTPVNSLDPDFKLGDEATTRQVLVRHLVCACTGLPRQDLEWLVEYGNATPASTMKLLGTMQPTTKFGETFQYSNLMAAAAGYVAGHVVYPGKERGAAYDEAMQTRVFGPLGMTDTTFDYAAAQKRDHATGYGPDPDGKIDVVIDVNRAAVAVRPAGEAWSSVHDVAKYVAMELAKGKLPGGKQVVSEAALLERRKAQVRVGEFTTYGMGLEVDTEFGVPVVHHGGALSGYYSDMFWLPEQGVGGVILTNAWPGWLFNRPFLRRTLEALYDGHPEADEDLASAIATYQADMSKERARLTIPPDPEVAGKLAKHYVSPALGDLTVAADGPARTFDFGEWKSPVASRKNDDGTTSFVTVGHGVAGWLELVPAERDGKRALVVRDMQHEYVFLETP